MLILIEGMDGSGKSTFADILQQHLIDKKRKTLLYKNKIIKHQWLNYCTASYTNFDASVEYYHLLKRNKMIDHLIIDRGYISECVYGKIIRKYDAWKQGKLIEEKLGYQDGIIVLVDAPVNTALLRAQFRGDDSFDYINAKVRKQFLSTIKKSKLQHHSFVNKDVHAMHNECNTLITRFKL